MKHSWQNRKLSSYKKTSHIHKFILGKDACLGVLTSLMQQSQINRALENHWLSADADISRTNREVSFEVILPHKYTMFSLLQTLKPQQLGNRSDPHSINERGVVRRGARRLCQPLTQVLEVLPGKPTRRPLPILGISAWDLLT